MVPIILALRCGSSKKIGSWSYIANRGQPGLLKDLSQKKKKCKQLWYDSPKIQWWEHSSALASVSEEGRSLQSADMQFSFVCASQLRLSEALN